jgi:hypothetical protein
MKWLSSFQGDGDDDLDDFTTALFVAAAVGLVLLAGLMSGLTLGLMSLDKVDLEVRAAAPSGARLPPACRWHASMAPRQATRAPPPPPPLAA